MAQGAEVVGVAALEADTRRLTAEGGPLDRALSAGAMSPMDQVAAAVRSTLPRDSGDLAGTVKVQTVPTGAGVSLGEGLLYAGPVDFGGWPEGRQYVSGGRYLFPAFANVDSAAVDAYSKATQRALDGFGWTNTGDTAHD